MTRLLACIRKELLLLSRDLHGLALLFAMPLAFVLIMSLALQNQFAERAGGRLKVLVLDADQSFASRALLDGIDTGHAFEFIVPQRVPDDATLTQQLRRGDYAFSIQINTGFGQRLLNAPADGAASAKTGLIDIGVAPDTGKQIETIFLGSVRAALGRERMRAMLSAVGNDADALDAAAASELRVHYAYARQAHPSAVQQSVPAWLVFGAFFVVVPLSNTLIRERQQGTLRRLRSTNLGSLTLLLGKLAPYFAINQLQVLLMLLAGRYLVPLLGGEALQINGSLALLAIMAATLSICALGLALLIAVSSSTTEQATLLGGTGNIILAALGGIMIPKFVMPATMQHIAQWSPMSWGLEGFLDVLLRSGGLRDIAPEASGLTALGLAAILLAWFIQSRRND
ncbi:MAG: ABC transporter permease [Steroidobacteraceae bacterium]